MYTYLKASKFALLLIMFALTNGCQNTELKLPCLPYSTDIEQGRALDEKKIKLLTEGLTSDQIKTIFGEPTIIEENTWEYIYYYKRPKGKYQITKLTLQFVDNKLKIWYKKP